MPKTKEQFAEMREQTKKRLMEVGLELFAEQGFYSTSISKIAKEAGMAKGAMYHYFESKDELLKSIIEMGMAEMGEMMAVLEMPMPAKEKLEKVIRMTVKMVEEQPRLWKLLSSLMLQTHQSPLVTALVKPMEQKGTELFVIMLSELGIENPKEEAYVLAGAIDGILFHYIMAWERGNPYPMESVLNQLISRY
ncbi:TetR/AcrR family transcriptional regulator [Limibacter armeniacum]|uniref:TetR/AcrR family transcriptional regulator n=1 Tax=Limibacter armeniacum TaxID=466084 RepID=UPI002FE5B5A5